MRGGIAGVAATLAAWMAASAPAAAAPTYAVVLHDRTPPAAIGPTARALARAHGGRIRSIWRAALPGFSATLPAAGARRLADDPRVAYVRRDARARVAGIQRDPPWGLDRIDQPLHPLDRTFAYPDSAGAVTVYVIDTGIRTTHAQFAGRATVGHDVIGDGYAGQDCYGHGTHVAGTIGGTHHGVAKRARLVSVRVYPCSGWGRATDFVDGVEWVTRNAVRPAVVNMSVEVPAFAPLDDAVERSIQSGLTYVIAAGNGDAEGRSLDACAVSPARVPAAITIGAADGRDVRPDWTNHGPCIDLFAPGADIVSASADGDTATTTMTGTSMAAPHAAGAAALIVADDPTATPAAVHEALVSTATRGVVRDPGSGSPDRLLRSRG